MELALGALHPRDGGALNSVRSYSDALEMDSMLSLMLNLIDHALYEPCDGSRPAQLHALPRCARVRATSHKAELFSRSYS